MIKIYFILILLFFYLINYGQDNITSTSNKNNLKWCDSTSRVLQIMKIDKVKNAYVIDVLDTCSRTLYRIVSLKKRMKNCNRLEVNKSYEMVIWPYFPCVNIVPNPSVNFIIRIDKHVINIPSTEWSANVFLSSDLVGLCYLGDLYP